MGFAMPPETESMTDEFVFSDAAREALSGTCFCLGLRKANRQVSRLYDEALLAHGLTVGQFGIMGHIEVLGGPSVQALADRLGMDQSALSRSLMPIEKTGLVVSHEDDSDRRRRIVRLSAAGRRRFDEAARSWQSAQRRIEELYGVRRSRKLRSRLRELVAELKKAGRGDAG